MHNSKKFSKCGIMNEENGIIIIKFVIKWGSSMNRHELKKKARASLKQNYWRAVIVAFLAILFINEGYQLVSFNIVNEESAFSNRINNVQIASDVLNNFSSYVESASASKGVLAVFANSIASTNSFLLGTLNGINKIIFHEQIASGVIIFIGVILGFLFWLFVSNTIEVSRNRFFLERVKHKNTPIDRILYVFRTKKILHVTKVMFFRSFYLLMWSLTIIGGIIKHYSYLMIPYILAENPNISKKDAFNLSRKIMNGQKWQCFKMDVSFIGWKILGFLTFNISNWLITEPYYQMTYAHIYMQFREKEIKGKTNLSEFFIDKHLNEEVDVYPEYLTNRNIRKWLKIDDKRTYSIYHLILMFFTFALCGWLWEVLYGLFTTGEFINKGTMFGPWLPIYGLGGILLLIFLSKYKEKPLIVFLLAMLVCGIIEYVGSVALESLYGLKWWDYSGFFLNIEGRVCLEGLILFGLGGSAIIYVFAPLLDNLYKKIPYFLKMIICLSLITIFAIDLGLSMISPNTGDGITTIASNITNKK